MRFARWIVLVLFVITTGVVAVGAPASANQVGTPPGGITMVTNTDFASFGVGGMRGSGTEAIEVTGITGTVKQALLYWNGPTNSTDPPLSTSVTFHDVTVPGTLIGVSHDNCWNFVNSLSYRADVTAQVLLFGNDTYDLSGFTNVNGASLIVFYDDGSPANNRDVTLADGNDSNVTNSFDPVGWDATMATAYTGGPANLQLHVSDGQSFEDGEVVLNNTELVSQGPNFQGDSVLGTFGGNPTGETGNLWDIISYTITSLMSPPATTLHLTSPLFDDCLSLVVALVAVDSAAIGVGVPGPPTINQALPGNTRSVSTGRRPTATVAARSRNTPSTPNPCPPANGRPPASSSTTCRQNPNAAPFARHLQLRSATS